MLYLCVQIRRPNNYDINVSLMLGPTDPDPTMDVSQLDIVKTVVQDSPHKLFIGGLPCDWSEDQVSSQSEQGLFCHQSTVVQNTLHTVISSAGVLPRNRSEDQGSV